MKLSLLLWIWLGPTVAPAPTVAELNAAFLRQLPQDNPEQALAVAAIQASYEQRADQDPHAFVPEALGMLYPVYDEAMQAVDAGDSMVALDILASLQDESDRYLRANVGYWRLRLLVEQERYEEALALTDAPKYARREMAAYTPFIEQFELMRAAAYARVLEFQRAEQVLAEQIVRDAPELVRNAARQLQLELEERRPETLDDVALYMDYVQERLQVTDTGKRVRTRQDEILEMLDKLIEEQEQNEQSGGGGGGGGKRAGTPQEGAPQQPGQNGGNPAEDSEERSGAGKIGDLHAAPRIEPGEMWGKLPPDERERILQSIRERFPSRYRQLVEQYYRALAEQP